MFDTLEIQVYIFYVYYYDIYVVLKYIIFTEEVPMGGGDVLLVEGCCFPLEEADTILQNATFFFATIACHKYSIS